MNATRGRRRVTVSRRPNNPIRAESEQPVPQADWRAISGMPFRLATALGMPPLFQDSCGPTAVYTAAAAAEAGSIISKVQQSQSSRGAVARAPANSGMQLWAAPEYAEIAADQSADSKGVGSVQLGRRGDDKRCRKRLAEAATVQPSTKRWRLEAHPDSMRSMGQQASSRGTADVAGLLSNGSGSRNSGQEGAEGGLALYTNHAVLGISSPAATRFYWFMERMDQLASQFI